MIIDMQSGNKVDICFRRLTLSDIKSYGLIKQNGWFKWRDEFKKEERKVYGMFVKGQDDIEGVISLEARYDNQLIHIGLMESAPHNTFNHPNQKYTLVGKNLLCFAMHLSFLHNFEGYIGLEAKMNKNEKYYQGLGAFKSSNGIPPYYYFNTNSSARVIEQYMPGGVQWC